MTKIAAIAGSIMALGAAQALAPAAAAIASRSRPELPDRASIEEESPFFTNFGGHAVAVRYNGNVRKDDVAEYCVSEGWIRVVTRVNGTLKRERGRLVCIKLSGIVEPFYR